MSAEEDSRLGVVTTERGGVMSLIGRGRCGSDYAANWDKRDAEVVRWRRQHVGVVTNSVVQGQWCTNCNLDFIRLLKLINGDILNI